MSTITIITLCKEDNKITHNTCLLEKPNEYTFTLICRKKKALEKYNYNFPTFLCTS